MIQNDGGTIPSRTEILNFSLKKLKGFGTDAGGSSGSGGTPDRERTIMQMLNVFRYCRLSNEPLAKPIVSDWNGFLYNKEKVLEYLLDRRRDGGDTMRKKKEREGLPDFESLNDVVQLKIGLEKNKLTCPLSNITLDITKDQDLKLSDVQFSYIVPCGCTMNTKILRELGGFSEETSRVGKETAEETAKNCPVCSTPFNVSDIIDINPQNSKSKDRLLLRKDRLRAQGLYHNLKRRKAKKLKRSRDSEAKKQDGIIKDATVKEHENKRHKSGEIVS